MPLMSKMLAAGVEANTISYNTVIKACAEAKGVVTAGQWMSKMLFAGLGAGLGGLHATYIYFIAL